MAKKELFALTLSGILISDQSVCVFYAMILKQVYICISRDNKDILFICCRFYQKIISLTIMRIHVINCNKIFTSMPIYFSILRHKPLHFILVFRYSFSKQKIIQACTIVTLRFINKSITSLYVATPMIILCLNITRIKM